MSTSKHSWADDAICLRPLAIVTQYLAEDIYQRVCRVDFAAPGFCVVNVGDSIGSIPFRQLMVELKREMAAIHAARNDDTLVYLSASRFDQQVSTKPHLDGGPDQSLLMLGYEPSEISAELELTDYSRCAFDLGLTPKEFMRRHNPMFKSGYELLRPYATRLPCFSPMDYQIVSINNSSAPLSTTGNTWQGTLHTATILNPDESKRRVINSTMITRASRGTADAIDDATPDHFVHTTEVQRRGYDKSHLDDDK